MTGAEDEMMGLIPLAVGAEIVSDIIGDRKKKKKKSKGLEL